MNQKDDAPQSAKALADRMAKAIENHAFSDAENLLCESNDVLTSSMRSLKNTGVTATVGNFADRDDKATATVRVVRKIDDKPVNVVVQMSHRDGSWCVDQPAE